MRRCSPTRPRAPPGSRQRVKTPVTAVPRYVVDNMGGWARPTFNGLGSVGEGDRVHVVVRTAGDMAGA